LGDGKEPKKIERRTSNQFTTTAKTRIEQKAFDLRLITEVTKLLKRGKFQFRTSPRA
jgi:hypothetical protein